MTAISKTSFQKQIKAVTEPLPGSIAYPTTYKLSVKKKFEGFNIIDFFLTIVPRSNKEIWHTKIKNQSLLINGKPANLLSTLKGGDITQHNSEPRKEPWINDDIKLLYDDEEIMIINKPAPLPMHPSGRFNKNSLTKILTLAFPEEDFKIVHRLDANTTGVVVLAKNKEIAESIASQFKNKSTQKTYLAKIEGIPSEDYFSTNTKIGLEKSAGGGRESDCNGIEAFTEFKVLERNVKENNTLLEVKPHTGRTNQIRLHLANLNLPIIGDHGYKDRDYFKNNPLTYNDDCLCLHAWKLNFYYKGEHLTIEAPIPKKFS
jgi:RluA family pseudouridine synthase